MSADPAALTKLPSTLRDTTRSATDPVTPIISRVVRATGLIGVIVALISASATFFVLTGFTPIEPTPGVVWIAMLVNGGLVAFLVLIVAWEVGSLLAARRRGKAASRLHIRIVALVSLLAAAPAALLTVTASATLDRGLDNWFSVRTRAIVDNSLQIAQAYAQQQAELLRADVRSAKVELERAGELLRESPGQFDIFFRALALDQRLSGAFLIQGDGTVLREAPFSDTSLAVPGVAILEQAAVQPDRVFIIPPGVDNTVGAVTRIVGVDDMFLFGTRPLSPDTARYLNMTNASVVDYRRLEATRSTMQIAFAILFLGVTMVVLLSAIWLGIGFANRLVSPIRRLIDAANEVSRGNLEVQVESRSADGDVGSLGATFNTMTAQLLEQREELVAASDQMDRRRRFTEAVLSGVTAGVVGIDSGGEITIANRSALRLLGLSPGAAVGAPITEVVPQLARVVGAALSDQRPEHRDQIVVRQNDRERTINVRVTTERSDDASHGYVITLDDITDLVTAQRSSAWADIARRIAHEIKNPLTPIQLSAERLKRKFGRVIETDRDVFEQCTDTIVRQVGDIGRMVDEFSSFARMPKPTFETGNLIPTIRESVFLISVSRPEIKFEIDVPEHPLIARFDARLFGQALANIVKNATEAIDAVPPDEARDGQIVTTARVEAGSIVIEVTDNGIGLPKENRRRLLEPYMTTREKGTGLGLAIVTKIVEEHKGRIELLDAPSLQDGGHGARVRITLQHIADPATDVAEQGSRPSAPGHDGETSSSAAPSQG